MMARALRLGGGELRSAVLTCSWGRDCMGTVVNAVRHFRSLLATGLLVGPGAGGVQAGGVTVVTHGAFGNVTDWIIPLSEQMADYDGTPASESSCYTLVVTGNATAPAVWLGGKKPHLSPTGELFIKLDWSDGAGFFGRDSPEVAAIAVAALTDPSLIPETGGRPLAELPLHLVGHSRGGSVVTEMAREFGERGIWVDQVTTLDPHPAFGDADIKVWENVLYADNYWQDEGDGLFTPNGEHVPGAYNRYLTQFSGGYSSQHSDVHFWYFGTTNLATPAVLGSISVTPTMRTTWWTGAEMAGAEAGYRYSRLGGGDRLSTFQPTGAGVVVDGFNKYWDLGAGINGNRAALATNSGAWPNVIRCVRSGSEVVAAGGSFEVAMHYQAGAEATGEVGLTVLLDVDANPWNGNEIVLDGGMVAKTGTEAVGLVPLMVEVGETAPGIYRVAVRLTDGGKSRVLYAAETVEVGMVPRIEGGTVRREGGLMKFTLLGTPGLTVAVRATEDFVEWEMVGTGVLVGGMWEFVDGETGMFGKRFYEVVGE